MADMPWRIRTGYVPVQCVQVYQLKKYKTIATRLMSRIDDAMYADLSASVTLRRYSSWMKSTAIRIHHPSRPLHLQCRIQPPKHNMDILLLPILHMIIPFKRLPLLPETMNQHRDRGK